MFEKVDGSEDRYTTPVGETDGRVVGGGLFLHLNRNKRELHFQSEKAWGRGGASASGNKRRSRARKSYPEGVADVGLDYESLQRMKSDIILVTSTGLRRRRAVR